MERAASAHVSQSLNIIRSISGTGSLIRDRVRMMFRNVLFPTDFSGHAKRALECVTGLPGIQEVILLHVADLRDTSRWGEQDIIAGAKRHLAEDRAYLTAKGITVHCVLRKTKDGSIGQEIIAVASSKGATAIVMSARGKGMVEGILLGTVSNYVLRNAPIHLLIMRYRLIEHLDEKTYTKFCPMILSRVVCPTDFSIFSDQTIQSVSGLPGLGELVLVHVVSSGETPEEIVAGQADAEKRLELIMADLTGRGIPARYHILTGNPATEINRLATEEDASLIALSSFGKGWIRDLMIGSTAAEVARTAERPVVIIRRRL
jgi:nucleotide-binding universal stress UspA family protein